MFESYRPAVILLVAMASWGCSTRPSGGQALGDDFYVGCTTHLSSPDERPWRRVDTETFSFCVPPDWRPVVRRGWGTTAAYVEWDLGAPVFSPGTKMPYTPGRTDLPETWKSIEVIGGAEAELWLQAGPKEYMTVAQWKTPEFHFVGSAKFRDDAVRQLEIYRTMRLTKSAGVTATARRALIAKAPIALR